MDFSENYVLKYASEIEASHFGASKKQISLHTSVVYYGGNIKPVSRHDPAAICAHLNLLVGKIKNNVPNLKTIHFASDGPSTQYRNKSMFYLASSYLSKVLNVENMFWHFSEAGHGKGAPDGVGGSLKRSADGLVGRGTDLSSLEVLVIKLKEACKGINILKIADEEFLEMDKFASNDLPSFKGTLKIHQKT
ncbi:unnamed protein product [Brassicogethes aeneus]|uniref:Uncharacterized protein n=1 Tax=Brassicogethes aeneus TaxID=1431903 RepID=A0A9P0B994_BRAAE|nr:unnamed protein product [Brassicogethes aeneus]